MSKLFEYIISSDYFHLKYARGRPSLSGQEFHNYDEIVLFISGEAEFISKDIQLTPLVPGTVVFIPKETYHQFIVTNNNDYVRCVLSFKEPSALKELIRSTMTEITLFPKPDSNALSVFDFLMQAAKKQLDEKENGLLLCSAVIQLLMEKKLTEEKAIKNYVTASAVTQDALEFIDSNIAEELTLKRIADALNMSASSLSHHFRRDMNIPVYRYISEKRLSMVRGYIDEGLSYSAAAALCGFKDYSCFFRLYKNRYGESPKGVKKR